MPDVRIPRERQLMDWAALSLVILILQLATKRLVHWWRGRRP